MNLFIGCSSSDEVLDKYKDTCSDLLQEIAKIEDVKLVFETFKAVFSKKEQQ